MELPRPTDLARELLAKMISPGDVVVDATAGNGHDTLFLAERVGETGKVLAFDVQAAAIESARGRVEAAGFAERVEVFQESHAEMEGHAEPGSVSAVMFNLGYLPGADHSVTTGADTLAGLAGAARILKEGGALSVICYPGHEGGDVEALEVEKWFSGLGDRWRVVKYGAIGTRKAAPFLLMGVRG